MKSYTIEIVGHFLQRDNTSSWNW